MHIYLVCLIFLDFDWQMARHGLGRQCWAAAFQYDIICCCVCWMGSKLYVDFPLLDAEFGRFCCD